jgi:hypothetical protein
MSKKKVNVRHLEREEPDELSEAQAEAVQGGAVVAFNYFQTNLAALGSKAGGEVISSDAF